MPRAGHEDGLTKFQRYRQSRHHKGMKLLRIWVPNPRTPAFAIDDRARITLNHMLSVIFGLAD